MSVSFGKSAKEFVEKLQPPPSPPEADFRSEDSRLPQFEVFGRLNLTNAMMASYYGVGPETIAALLRRTDIRRAYERGRAEAIIAVRQKQLTVALAGDVRLLVHAGVHFAEQQATEDVKPRQAQSPRGWDTALATRAAAIRDKFQAHKETGGA